jgi:hypothetical protein
MLPLLALCLTQAEATEIGSGRAFGLGIQLGEPSGLTGKFYLGGRRNAIDFAIGAYYADNGPWNDAIYAQAAYHWHLTELAHGNGVSIPFRVGIGGFFTSGYYRWSDRDYDVVLGARVPIGLDFDLDAAPVQFYAEIGFQLTVAPPFRVGGDGAIGVRYYF